ncbi:restriction endonuclease subunit S [Candidatus Blastococcus massiliensis]|uniref:restriction endonuclease subunit S n=1 Tax=Candidatus Blastococcus massiliensis TaxID=1470358 RepID=UPI0004B314F0|nr:restriction endonuclease subunit S [Candidatus Blastococcus massiliensis]
MTVLPDGWRMATIDEIAAPEPRSITDGPFGSNLTRAHYTASGPRVVRLQNIGDGRFVDAPAHISEEHFESLRTHEVRAGDLLMASLGETLPRACLAPASLGRAIVKADCIRVRLSEKVDPRWALYALQRPEARRWADRHRHGMGRPRLGLAMIRQTPIPLPSLDEQRRIVDILEDHLSRLDAANDYLSACRRRATTLGEQSIAQALLGRSGADSELGGEPIADYTPQDGHLAELPRGWSWRRLGELADVVGGVTKDAKRQADPTFVEVPYLRVANVQRGRLDLSTVTGIRVSQAKADALRLQPGDVLMNEGGDRDKLARGWVWEGQIEDCIHQNHVFRARVRDDAIDPRLLSWVANTIGGKWAERNGKQSVNLASISLSKIRQMPVPLPPREIQLQLVESIQTTLDAAARLADTVQAQETRSSALRRALLTAAFAGRLTRRDSDSDQVEKLAMAGSVS